MINRILVAAALVLASTSASAQSTLRARDTAETGAKGSWSVGVFNPLRYGVTDKVELETAPLVFLLGAPNAVARVPHISHDKYRLTGEYGLSIPTLGLRALRNKLYGAADLPLPGTFFPAWSESGQDVGWFLVPTAGLVASGGAPLGDTWTARADLALGIPLGSNSANPLDSFVASLNLLTAPVTNKFRARVGGAYDKALGDRWRVRGELNFHLVGSPGELGEDAPEIAPLKELSPVYVTGHLGADVAIGQRNRLTFGVWLANYDQGEIVESKGADGFRQVESVRSWNLLPTIDFIWAGGI